MQTVMVKCGCCRGEGLVRLGEVYTRTLALLRRQTHPVNGAALAQVYGCRPEAMCNRLRGLAKYGLAKCVKNGRENLWTDATPESEVA